MFDQALFIFNQNLCVDLRDQLLLKYKLEFENFCLFQNPMVVSFLLIDQLQDLDIIWLVNLKIYTEVFISGFF